MKSEMTTVTYSFADGTKQSQPINKEAINHHKGGIMELFKQTMSDKGAIAFTVNAEDDSQLVKEEVEYFTAKERKNAKRDYEEFRKGNPEEFFKQLNKFRGELTDKLTKRLRFNLVNLDILK